MVVKCIVHIHINAEPKAYWSFVESLRSHLFYYHCYAKRTWSFIVQSQIYSSRIRGQGGVKVSANMIFSLYQGDTF